MTDDPKTGRAAALLGELRAEFTRMQREAGIIMSAEETALAVGLALQAVAEEREECARLCDVQARDGFNTRDEAHIARQLGDAIRSRGAP